MTVDIDHHHALFRLPLCQSFKTFKFPILVYLDCIHRYQAYTQCLFQPLRALPGNIPPELRNCTALYSLDLSNNQLTGACKFWIIFIARVAPGIDKKIEQNSIEQ